MPAVARSLGCLSFLLPAAAACVGRWLPDPQGVFRARAAKKRLLRSTPRRARLAEAAPPRCGRSLLPCPFLLETSYRGSYASCK